MACWNNVEGVCASATLPLSSYKLDGSCLSQDRALYKFPPTLHDGEWVGMENFLPFR